MMFINRILSGGGHQIKEEKDEKSCLNYYWKTNIKGY